MLDVLRLSIGCSPDVRDVFSLRQTDILVVPFVNVYDIKIPLFLLREKSKNDQSNKTSLLVRSACANF